MFRLKEMTILHEKEPGELVRIQYVYRVRYPFFAPEREVYMIGIIYMTTESIQAMAYNKDGASYHNTGQGQSCQLSDAVTEKLAHDVLTRLQQIQGELTLENSLPEDGYKTNTHIVYK